MYICLDLKNLFENNEKNRRRKRSKEVHRINCRYAPIKNKKNVLYVKNFFLLTNRVFKALIMSLDHKKARYTLYYFLIRKKCLRIRQTRLKIL